MLKHIQNIKEDIYINNFISEFIIKCGGIFFTFNSREC